MKKQDEVRHHVVVDHLRQETNEYLRYVALVVVAMMLIAALMGVGQ